MATVKKRCLSRERKIIFTESDIWKRVLQNRAAGAMQKDTAHIAGATQNRAAGAMQKDTAHIAGATQNRAAGAMQKILLTSPAQLKIALRFLF